MTSVSDPRSGISGARFPRKIGGPCPQSDVGAALGRADLCLTFFPRLRT